MLSFLLVAVLLGQLVNPVLGEDCTELATTNTTSTTCGSMSANGCCAKGCIRNTMGRCIAEECTGSWTGWLSRPVTMSCYFHWFLLIFGAIIGLIMVFLIVLNLAFEVRLCLRKRQQDNRQSRYVRFSPRSSPSSSNV
ncbi:uncharacterized protein LOC6569561 [Drosophila grimshawi]|uniref:GH14089 n=1 Tax=Drosophila grimshawi TaxID=7222 RepID=B4JY42_DROGR|nr:uncharacterized protein LOC6569561 [Drosophila grimshawi]EDV90604.1 GH14089 [Drosophila grimshawi]